MKDNKKRELILASASPRRQELLKNICKDFLVVVSDCEEIIDNSQAPALIVESLALQKAENVFSQNNHAVVIGCDTVVACDGEILGKPKNSEDAKNMLNLLSDKTHQVLTGVCIMGEELKGVFSVCTEVTFKPLSEEEIESYIDTNEPFDKAGAYGIQGFGGAFVRGIVGDYFSVMGLPINQIYEHLRQLKLDEFLKLS